MLKEGEILKIILSALKLKILLNAFLIANTIKGGEMILL